MSNPRILIIDDDISIARALGSLLPDEGFDPVFAHNGREGLQLAREGDFETVVTDLRLPGLGGMELIQTLRQCSPKVPIVMITAHGTTETAIQAMQKGAFEYLLKPYEIPELIDVLKRAVSRFRMSIQTVALGQASPRGDALIGSSRPMQKVYKDIGRFASKPVTVLIKGETGTGKELVARALYQYSDRCDKPFVALNCAALPESLLESELFGHERGAFTGADCRKVGRFEQANGGTLFLDEIGDLAPGTQVKLLRALQEKTIQRLGGQESLRVDTRVIAATHVDLDQAIAIGRFREDLFYRLNGIIIEIPPLRERKEDIPSIAEYLLAKYIKEFNLKPTGLSPGALRYLQEHNWPGNVRELENALRKALLECEGFTVSESAVRQAVVLRRPEVASEGDGALPDLLQRIAAKALHAARQGQVAGALSWLEAQLEKELYRMAIEQSGGNLAKAARWLGVSRLTMRQKLRKHGLRPD